MSFPRRTEILQFANATSIVASAQRSRVILSISRAYEILVIRCLVQAIQRIAAKENINMFFPVSMAQYSAYESLAASLLPKHTICCTTDPHWTALLNDKIAFTKYADSIGMDVPAMFSITSKEQLMEYNKK